MTTSWNARPGSLKGPRGDQGPVGPQGPQGSAGNRGPQGEKGELGEQGPAGAGGPQGNTGPKGDAGERGLQGLTGGPGPQGIQGTKGDTGAKGDKGFTGDTGANGLDGRTILSTTGKPLASAGRDGDYAIDTAAAKLYGPKTTGAWPNGRNLQGPAGQDATGSGNGSPWFFRHSSPTGVVTLGGAASSRWYVAGQMTAVPHSGSAAILNANRFMMLPFYSGRGGNITQMACYTSAASAAIGKMAIYTNLADGSLYPSDLIYEAPAVGMGSVGTKVADVGVVLQVNQLYWVGITVNVNTTLRTMNPQGAWPLLGVLNPTTNLAGIGWYYAFPSWPDPLPTTFPGGAGVMDTGTNPPAISLFYGA